MADFETDDDNFLYDEDKMGMRITSGSVKIIKDDGNLIGISIGGGAPNCPCLYVVQVFDNTPASKDGTLEAGDEIISVNGKCVKGSTKVEVARLIQSIKEEVTIGYNKLHADPKQGKSLDIVLKKLKHKMVENMSSATADALGLSRAILCNDSLIKKLQELDRNELIFKGLISHFNYVIKSYVDLVNVYKDFGNVFSEIGAHEPQTDASVAFTKFGEIHRFFEKEGFKLTNSLKPVLGDLNTYLNKAIPDTRLTIKKYADVKFEYLSYCLKVKEMDDEEYTYQALQEPLYRVETGNYEYRLILRSRQEARKRFAALRSDVLIKMELLDQKHVHNVANQLNKFISLLSSFNSVCHKNLSENSFCSFELDLSKSCLLQQVTASTIQENFVDDTDINNEEVIEPGEDVALLADISDYESTSQTDDNFRSQNLVDIFDDEKKPEINNLSMDLLNDSPTKEQTNSDLSSFLLF